MFFNKVIFILFIGLFIGLNLSCSKKMSPVGGASTKINNLFSTQDICWKNFSKTVNKYFSAKQDIKQFNAFWLCVDQSINLFTNYVESNNQNQYLYIDIKNILYKIFKQNISADKIFSIFSLLKDLSFFKNINSISKQDIAFLKFALKETKLALGNLLPYKKILFSTEPQSVNYKDYVRATAELDKSFNRIANLFVKQNSSYSKKSLNSLLQLFFKEHKAISKFVFSSKVFLTKDKNSRQNKSSRQHKNIATQDWHKLFSSVSFLYSAYLGFKLYYTNTGIKTNANTETNTETNKDFKHLQAQFKYAKYIENSLKSSLANQEGNAYLITDIKNLILDYNKITTSSLIINKDVVDQAWIVINHLLEKNSYLNKNTKLDDKFFSMQHFLSLKALGLKYFYVQSLNLNFLGISKKSLFNKTKLVIKHKQKVFATLDLTSIKKSFNQISSTAVGKQKMDQTGRLLFSGSYNTQLLLNNLTKLNYENLLIDLIFSAYAGTDNKINQTELNFAFDQVKEIFINAKILDSSSAIANTIYRETNLFMPSSKIDKQVDRQEALEYVHYIFSGLNIQSSWSKLVKDNCSVKTVGLNQIYKTSCVYSQFLKNKNNYFSFLFDQKHLGFNSNPKEWFTILSIGAGHKESDFFFKKNLFNTGMLLQYIATIFNRFDTDKNFLLSYEESLMFFPFISEALQHFLPITDQLELQNLYTYLLNYGKLPNYETDPLGELHLFSWSLQKNKDYQACFFQVLRVFRSMRALAI